LTIVLLISASAVQAQSPPEPEFIPITVDNVAQLELGFAVEGPCNFSPDGRYLVSYDAGVLDIATGEIVFPQGGNFSPDMSLFSADDGLYEVEGWQQRFSTSNLGYFSPDSSMVAIGSDGVYDTTTGELLFPAWRAAFSPDSSLVAVTGEGVYEVETSDLRFPTETNHHIVFSPDGTMAAVGFEGVYDTQSGERLFDIGEYGYFTADSSLFRVRRGTLIETATGREPSMFSGYLQDDTTISPDIRFVAFGDGSFTVYDFATGEVAFTFYGSYPTFNHDSTLMVVGGSGVYDTSNGHLLLEFPFPGHVPFWRTSFNVDETLLMLQLDSADCLIYGIEGFPWPFRNGLVQLTGKPIFDSPSGEMVRDSAFWFYPVYEFTEDREWLRITEGENQQWVRVADVDILSLPDGIPVFEE
jgi:WD40 repeat protein